VALVNPKDGTSEEKPNLGVSSLIRSESRLEVRKNILNKGITTTLQLEGAVIMTAKVFTVNRSGARNVAHWQN
jgi:hypothetical protein